MSRSTEWGRAQLAKGNCWVCGKPRTGHNRFCDHHAKLHRAYDRKRKRKIGNFNPWKPGGRGRPPIEKEVQ